MDTQTTKAFDKVFDRLNTTCETVVRIDQLLKDKLHAEPCDNMTAHLQDHKSAKRDWRKAIIGGVVKLIIIAIVAAVTVIVTVHKCGGTP
jgi:hypothetical protein